MQPLRSDSDVSKLKVATSRRSAGKDLTAAKLVSEFACRFKSVTAASDEAPEKRKKTFSVKLDTEVCR